MTDGTPDAGVGASGIDLNTISGLDDHIVTEIFDEPVVTAEPPPGMFAEADDKDTVVCVCSSTNPSLPPPLILLLTVH